MESMQANKPNIQKTQDNNSHHHQKNNGFEVLESQDQGPHKWVTESKNNEEEKKMIIMEECENNGDHNEEVLESMEKKKKNNSNGGVLLGPRDKLKKHRREVAGQVWIPDMWGHESLLKDWVDCTAFDASLMPKGIMLARASLMEEARRSNSNNPLSLRLERSSC